MKRKQVQPKSSFLGRLQKRFEAHCLSKRHANQSNNPLWLRLVATSPAVVVCWEYADYALGELEATKLQSYDKSEEKEEQTGLKLLKICQTMKDIRTITFLIFFFFYCLFLNTVPIYFFSFFTSKEGSRELP